MINRMAENYITQPKLDGIATRYLIKKQLNRFRTKIEYIRGRREGRNLHEFEIKAFKALGRTLLRKSILGLKIMVRCRHLKAQETKMIKEY